MKTNQYKYVLLYLISILTANLLVAKYGPAMAVINSFLFIGLDLTCRDKLHEGWHHDRLMLKMTALISAGSLLTWMIQPGAGQIAAASAAAFCLAALADTLVYSVMFRTRPIVKVNGSNLVSSAVDSIVFPALAWGGIDPMITLQMFSAKLIGGLSHCECCY